MRNDSELNKDCSWTLALRAVLAGVCLTVLAARAAAQTGATPQEWARRAATCQVAVMDADRSFSVQFRQSKHDNKGEMTRVVLETRDGSVARLVERDGHALTPEQDKDERARLQELLDSPSDFASHHKRDAGSRDYAQGLLHLMPTAMIFTFADGVGRHGDVVVLDFRPDPAFRPPTLIANLLTGLAGRVTLDAASGCMTRVEGRVIKPVNFGFGVIARIAAGGTVDLEQKQVLPGKWIYTTLREHLKVRALLFKVLPEDTEIGVTDIQPIGNVLGYQDASRKLLGLPVPVK